MIRRTIPLNTKVFHEKEGIGKFIGWTEYGDAIVEFNDEIVTILRKDLTEIEGEPMNLYNELADLEHQQWAHWTKYMLEHLTPENIKRWKKQTEMPYAELSEKEKDSDREWAEKVLKIVRKHLGAEYVET